MQPAEHQMQPEWMVRRGLLFPILFFFICLFIYSKVSGPIISMGNTNPNYFVVDGTGEVKAQPNAAELDIAVSAHAATQDDAKNQMNVTADKIVAALKAIGIREQDIQTQFLQTNPYYGPEKAAMIQGLSQAAASVGSQSLPPAPPSFPPETPPAQNGFLVSETLTVKTNQIALAGKIFDIANANGATGVGGPTYTFDSSTDKSLQDQAQVLAIKDAKDKAQRLSSQAGLKLGRLVNIQTNSFRPVGYAMSKDAGGTGNTNTNPQPGQNTVTATVTLSYETK